MNNLLLPDNVKIEDISDGYHTFKELYEFRMVYNAALFNEWHKQNKYYVHKKYSNIKSINLIRLF